MPRPGLYNLFLALLLIFFSERSFADNVKLQLILPLSGPLAPIGEAIRDGALLAQEDLGDLNKVQLAVEDNRGNTPDTIAAFRSLSRPDVLGVFPPGAIHAVAPLADAAKLPMFAFTASSIKVGPKFVMRHLANLTNQANALIEHFHKNGIKRIAIIATQNEPMLEAADVFTSRFGSTNVAVFEKFTPGELDFRSWISRIKEIELDAVIILLFPPQISAFARQAQAVKLGIPLAGFANLENPSEVAAAGGALEGAVTAVSCGDSSFTERFISRFKRAPILGAANGYEVVRIINEATNGPKPLLEGIQTLDYHGVMGNYRFDPKNGEFLLPAVLKVVKNGAFVLAKN